jgi:hypothetical protein
MQSLSADESTVNFKDHVVFKMYNQQKPTKWGLHVYAIADSTNVYVRGLIPYYGSTTTERLMHPELTFTENSKTQQLISLYTVTLQYNDSKYISVNNTVHCSKTSMPYNEAFNISTKATGAICFLFLYM